MWSSAPLQLYVAPLQSSDVVPDQLCQLLQPASADATGSKSGTFKKSNWTAATRRPANAQALSAKVSEAPSASTRLQRHHGLHGSEVGSRAELLDTCSQACDLS